MISQPNNFVLWIWWDFKDRISYSILRYLGDKKIFKKISWIFSIPANFNPVWIDDPNKDSHIKLFPSELGGRSLSHRIIWIPVTQSWYSIFEKPLEKPKALNVYNLK